MKVNYQKLLNLFKLMHDVINNLIPYIVFAMDRPINNTKNICQGINEWTSIETRKNWVKFAEFSMNHVLQIVFLGKDGSRGSSVCLQQVNP